MPKSPLLATLAAILLAGCSSEGGGGAAAESLTSYLPEIEGEVHYVDLVGVKVTYGVDLAADPLAGSGRSDFGYFGLVGEALPLLTRRFDPDLNDALRLEDATEAAGILAADGEAVSVIKTDAELTAIRAALEEIGFEAAGEDLVRGGREPVAIRLADDRILLAPSVQALAGAQSDGGDPPAPVISELEGVAISIEPGGGDCVLSTAAVAAEEGFGELVFEIDGEPSVNGPYGDDPSGELAIGEPLTDGSLVVVPLAGGERESAPAQVALENDYLEYDCGAA